MPKAFVNKEDIDFKFENLEGKLDKSLNGLYTMIRFDPKSISYKVKDLGKHYGTFFRLNKPVVDN